ncbi:MAG TPA: GMC oxidoreductase [Candidatus Dormibacteraeota bacterium]|nr:GMC oxidoreductase [Candidatus Dormibacteraeota bacterium]
MASEASTDVLIIGSGPVGSAFARTIHELRPTARLLMVEVGPRLTDPPGMHVKNIVDAHERLIAQVRSQGPHFTEEALRAAAALAGRPPDGTFARPGTFYVDPERAARGDAGTLGAAAMSSNVGGMGAHWTCACPYPAGHELVPFVPGAEWRDALETAKRLLAVTQDAFPRTPRGEAVLRALKAEFDRELPPERQVQPMPMACRLDGDGRRYWSGTDVVLGPLATDPPATFRLCPETLCTRLVVEGSRVVAARLRHLPSRVERTVSARAVVVACDGLRTPQLLWASGIRPRALGHFLNDHIQLMGAAHLDPRLIEQGDGEDGPRHQVEAPGEGYDPIVGVFWIPYSEQHPVHGQVMHLDMSPIAIGPAAPDRAETGIVGVGYFIPKDIRYQDRVTFSESEVDVYGMPKIEIHYGFTDRDRESIDRAKRLQARAAAALGGFAPGHEPRLMPAGSSLHYQGSVRMGEADDGTSVCDPHCRVWGLDNLFVGGNGVIPTPTAGNPTLSSVAHAVRAARQLARSLSAAGTLAS